jgi:phosphatidylserine decarboxylase
LPPIHYIHRPTGEQRIESPPGEGFLKFLYHHPLGPLAVELLVKRRLLSEVYGRRMRSSGSKKQIRRFIETYQVDEAAFLKPTDQFESFNDFFIRKLKPEARPLAEGLVSPADGKVLAFPKVSALNEFFVKGHRFTLHAFLGDRKLAERYQDGPLFVIRLAPPDYHRFHFPYAGTPSESQPIPGGYLSVSPYATRVDFARVFTENKRAFTLLQTLDQGQILLAPVGATMVGSIVHTYAPEQPVAKGEEMGYFAFGGSCLIMLLEPNQVKIDEDLMANTARGLETTVQMGERLGSAPM